MMNRDDTYMALLIPGSLSFLTVEKSYPPVPAYLLPAKVSLYSNAKRRMRLRYIRASTPWSRMRTCQQIAVSTMTSA
jgi:hypothetical protein